MEEVELDREFRRTSEEMRFWPKWMRKAGHDYVIHSGRQRGAEVIDEGYSKMPSRYILITNSKNKKNNFLEILRDKGYSINNIKKYSFAKGMLQYAIKVDDEIDIEILRELKKKGYHIYRNLTCLLGI